MATFTVEPVSFISPDTDAVTCEVFIAAPRERVFEALTDPKQALQWWGQSDHCQLNEFHMDVRPGGKWSTRARSATMGSKTIEGEFLEIDPPRRLAYTWNASWMAKTTKVLWELEVGNDGTFLKLTHTGFAGDVEQAKNHSVGWNSAIGGLRTYTERGETVASRN